MSGAPKEQQSKSLEFTPIHPFDLENPKTWGATIGGLNWDNDKIVFSKRSLLEFLKSCQLTVNTNFTEIQKLYATFGRFSQAATDAAVADLVEAEIADPSKPEDKEASGSTGQRTTRKVIDPPGGKQSLKIYGEEYEEADALSLAPPPNGGSGVDVDVDRMQHLKVHVEPEVDGGATIEDIDDAVKGAEAKADAGAAAAKADDERVSNAPAGFRPTRKVREGPGGKSQMGSVLFGGYEDETEEDRAAARAPTGGKRQAQQTSGGGLW
ncbi:uncharacterized protein LOC62_03G004879 [Vanrija pseudolonga]|uniref:Uncharacterized protein n=1 Tax=Vanrija pseudolonga TaxID=143232 RepID=A0AAF0YAS9_9TREE|nr:hypothetical protein LOC62_03G004879 [Vanrija pseudolonga]